MLSLRSLRLSFILILSLFYSVSVISTNLSSSLLICTSASIILLFILYSIYFISVIIQFMSFFVLQFSSVIVKHFLYPLNPGFYSFLDILDHLYYRYSEFFFRQIASLLFIYLSFFTSLLPLQQLVVSFCPTTVFVVSFLPAAGSQFLLLSGVCFLVGKVGPEACAIIPLIGGIDWWCDQSLPWILSGAFFCSVVLSVLSEVGSVPQLLEQTSPDLFLRCVSDLWWEAGGTGALPLGGKPLRVPPLGLSA